MLHYCKKCGRTIIKYEFDTHAEYICDCCGNEVLPVPKKFLDEECDDFLKYKKEETKQLLWDELVKTSPEFDPYLFEHRDEILLRKSFELQAKLDYGRAILEGRDKGNPYGVTCPYCKATNVKKISYTKRAVKTGIFGILGALDDAGKTYQCSKCGGKF